MMTKSYITCSEFIGTEVEIIRSNNFSNMGIRGEVIGETRNTFTILSQGKRKIIAKNFSLFNFRLTDGKIMEIEGRLLLGRPEIRLKKYKKRMW